MKSKILLALVSVIFGGFLGLTLGLNLGIDIGEAKFHNERVRYFQTDVMETARKMESPIKDALIKTAKFAGEMIDDENYPDARREYIDNIRKMQNNSRQ